jgi:hypothetical protein
LGIVLLILCVQIAFGHEHKVFENVRGQRFKINFVTACVKDSTGNFAVRDAITEVQVSKVMELQPYFVSEHLTIEFAQTENVFF